MVENYLKEFEKLNEYQKKAVMCDDKYALLNAVVGSGKTTVLIHKVMYLHIIKKIPLEDIMVFTFTNKAADEIIDRVLSLSSGLKERIKYFGTFHSVAKTILNESQNLENLGYKRDFEIIDNSRAADMLNNILEGNKLNIKYKNRLSKRIDEFKKGKSLFGIMKKDDDIEKLYRLYNEEKIKNNFMDFDDIIDNCIKVLDKPLNPSYIIIDEFQDTDLRQFELIRRIAGDRSHIFAIGDENQIIYSFRTGNDKIFDKFKSLYNPKEFSLPINYRSSRTIIEAAKSFLNRGSIESIKDYGNPIIVRKHLDSFNEALYVVRRIKELNSKGVSFKDIAVLYRRTAQAEVLYEVFKRENIPLKIVFKGETIFECSEEERDTGLSVNLMTLHASKGLEFSHVFIVGANMGNIPISSKRGEEEEELRLFFVGITRAKNYLEISYVIKPNLQGVLPYQSPYISMIPSNLIKREEESRENSLSNLYRQLRDEKEKKELNNKVKKALHAKYGEGIVIYEDENIIKVNFEGYGEKEFSKLFCPLEFK
ncbi:UvrD-like helicase C-terminal domain-containing protein [Caloramator quimbayensis]|uniref:DNA 3'-5' helicase n=1 Tax=Caloramator quimbayensis TaxID=1147123 RepID=A0A1T4XUJ6_9CLOT|nr:ATP-dependent helicase [Caloramator quimbayensis]SKA93210.1 UvrD-like helicase C-terminal domain-containing protein [Caloramator quimbayensis]